jgi:hypothetical protein
MFARSDGKLTLECHPFIEIQQFKFLNTVKNEPLYFRHYNGWTTCWKTGEPQLDTRPRQILYIYMVQGTASFSVCSSGGLPDVSVAGL